MFTDDDLVKYKSMAKVIEQSKLEIEGSAVIQTALLIQWYSSLGPKIQNYIAQKKVESEPIETTPLEKPIGDDVGEKL